MFLHYLIKLAQVLGIICFAPGVFGQIQNINSTATGSCSPAIGINYGPITINCPGGLSSVEREKLNNLPGVKAYNSHVAKVNAFGKSLIDLKKNMQAIKDRTLRNQKKESKEIRRLKKDLANERIKLEKLAENQSLFATKVSKELAKKLSKTQEQIESNLAQASALKFESLESKIEVLDLRLFELESRVDALENDVSLLMSSYFGGDLEDTLVFLGAGVGEFIANGDASFQPSLELEFTAPWIPYLGRRSSVFLETGYLDWKENREYTTLPETDTSEFKEDNSFGYLGLGLRVAVFPIKQFGGMYLGLSGGHSVFGEEDTFYVSPAVGFEYLRRSARFAIDARWNWFSSINETSIEFNPMGLAYVRESSSSESGFTLGARISFRLL